MMQAYPLLHETLPGECRVARLDADRGARADAIEQLLTVVDDLHAELGQPALIEGAGTGGKERRSLTAWMTT